MLELRHSSVKFFLLFQTFALSLPALIFSQAADSVPTENSVSVNFAAASVETGSRISAVGAIGMTVSDMDRSIAFFSDVLSFQTTTDVEVSGRAYEQLQGLFGLRMRVVRMQLGEEEIALIQYLSPPDGKPIPVDSRSNDLWFQHIAIVVSDMDAAYQHLRQHAIQHVSPAPQTIPEWNTAAAGIRAFYFRDPDGHNLELIYFPPGKGQPKWQLPTGRLFLGIDHTAIAVRDTQQSLRFYRDVLGLDVAGESENYGIEQERLNNVFGARLRITGLRAPHGPGIELLEYLTPTDGRPLPHHTQTNDLVHWQTPAPHRHDFGLGRHAPDQSLSLYFPHGCPTPQSSPGVFPQLRGT